MNRQDVMKMFYMIKAVYQRPFANFTETETKNYIDAWSMVFSDIPAEKGFAGLKTYLTTEKSGFPPSPGQIMDCIHRLELDNIPNEMEAWTIVEKAVQSGSYKAEQEFAKLPQIIRRAVRHPSRLREWGMMDINTFQSVEQSNFLRTYRAEVERERNNRRIPADIRPQLEVIADPKIRIEDKHITQRQPAPDADIEKMIKFLKGDNG